MRLIQNERQLQTSYASGIRLHVLCKAIESGRNLFPAMSYYDERKNEILDGKRTWTFNTDAGGDPDLFHTAFVVPVRRLRDEGMFDDVHEAKRSFRGRVFVAVIDITSAVNFGVD
jgi:hypothetical protein